MNKVKLKVKQDYATHDGMLYKDTKVFKLDSQGEKGSVRDTQYEENQKMKKSVLKPFRCCRWIVIKAP